MPQLVSAIIPTYNRAGLLRRALASVAAQTYRPLQAVVVDDGGHDDTPDVIAGEGHKLRAAGVELLFHRQPNGGPGKARNTGIALAGGGLITFLDSDDLWKPQFVATLRGLLESHPSAGLAVGGMLIIDADDRVWTERGMGLDDLPAEGLLEKPFPRILRHMPMGTPCVMVRKAVLDDVGAFDPSYRLGEDWDLWYRVARKYDFAYTREALTLCREHPDNTPKWSAAAWADVVRLDLQQLPHVADPGVREMLRRRIRGQTILLQEQLLREGKGRGPAAEVVAQVSQSGLAPPGVRYRLGSALRRGPRWMGRTYAGAVRVTGSLLRRGKEGKAGKA